MRFIRTQCSRRATASLLFGALSTLLYLGFVRLSTVYTLADPPPFMLAIQALWHLLLFAVILFSLLGLIFGLTSLRRFSGLGLLKTLAGLSLSVWPLVNAAQHFLLFIFGFILCIRNIFSIRTAADFTSLFIVLILIMLLLAAPILYRIILIKYIKNIKPPKTKSA